MGAGKSTCGPILARRLGWEFVDLDEEVAAAAGAPVSAIFAGEGEATFRAREAEASRGLLRRERLVIATGGGWASNPGVARPLPAGTRVVWLRAEPEELVRRLGPEPGAERPLLRAGDPAEVIRRLLEQREPRYAAADLAVDTTGRAPAQVAAEIEERLLAHPRDARDPTFRS